MEFGKVFSLGKKTGPSLDDNINGIDSNCYISINQLTQSSSWSDATTLLKSHKIKTYYVTMAKKDGKKSYKGVVKSPLREIQNGY